MKQEVICEKVAILFFWCLLERFAAFFLESYVGLLICNQLTSITVEDVYWKIILFRFGYHSTILGILLTFLFRYLSLKESLQISFLWTLRFRLLF